MGKRLRSWTENLVSKVRHKRKIWSRAEARRVPLFKDLNQNGEENLQFDLVERDSTVKPRSKNTVNLRTPKYVSDLTIFKEQS